MRSERKSRARLGEGGGEKLGGDFTWRRLHLEETLTSVERTSENAQPQAAPSPITLLLWFDH